MKTKRRKILENTIKQLRKLDQRPRDLEELGNCMVDGQYIPVTHKKVMRGLLVKDLEEYHKCDGNYSGPRIPANFRANLQDAKRLEAPIIAYRIKHA